MIRSCQRIMITGHVFKSFWQKIASLRRPKLSCTGLTGAFPQPSKAGLYAFPGMFDRRRRILNSVCWAQTTELNFIRYLLGASSF